MNKFFLNSESVFQLGRGGGGEGEQKPTRHKLTTEVYSRQKPINDMVCASVHVCACVYNGETDCGPV